MLVPFPRDAPVLSKTTLEAAKHLRRPELGAVVGSCVSRCVKTPAEGARRLGRAVRSGGLCELLAATGWRLASSGPRTSI